MSLKVREKQRNLVRMTELNVAKLMKSFPIARVGVKNFIIRNKKEETFFTFSIGDYIDFTEKENPFPVPEKVVKEYFDLELERKENKNVDDKN